LCAANRKVVVTPLKLTEAGHAQVRKLHALRLAALDVLLSALPPDEQQHFTSMLDTME
jgi:DNA-binding MarR family transcriptional regulator